MPTIAWRWTGQSGALLSSLFISLIVAIKTFPGKSCPASQTYVGLLNDEDMKINWILEREVFNDNHDRLAEAATKAGHKVVSWDDFWWENGNWPSLENEHTIFHGSLGNANRIASELPWNPGAIVAHAGI